MAQQLNWTSNQVPGSLSVTGSQADTTARECASGNRCPRCERQPWQTPCGGVYGDPVHLGS